MQKAVGSGDMAVLPATAQGCLWSLATHLQPHNPHGVVAKQLFVLTPGLYLAIFGLLLIGRPLMEPILISAAAAPQLSMYPAQTLHSWCSHWAKIAMPIFW